MYTSYIGRKFLKLFKEKYGKPDTYSARLFFDEVLFPLFFDNEQHLMHVHGSTFFQKIGKEELKSGISESLLRLSRLHKDISNKRYSGSTYVGYAAEKIDEVTSGQVTSLDCKIDAEEMYCSWIGEGLSIGLNGGLILLKNEEILLMLYEGWEYYRKYIKQTPNLKGRQIETWNGHWLNHRLDKNFNPHYPLDNFELSIVNSKDEKGGVIISIPTLNWSNIIFSLSKKFPNSIMSCYSYFLGKTNTTLGFINLYLPEIVEMYELRDKIFINNQSTILKDEQIEKLETFYTFKNACKMGAIGLKSIEPAKLREYMPKGSVDYAQGKDFKFSDENSYFYYSLYKLWIIAMLNKTELLNLASEVAQSLLDFQNEPNNRGKKDLETLAEEVKNASNIKNFIDKLTILLDKKQENADVFKNVVEQILKMPTDNFPLFATLIRFEYSYFKSKK